jgi:hypothetical protein
MPAAPIAGIRPTERIQLDRSGIRAALPICRAS